MFDFSNYSTKSKYYFKILFYLYMKLLQSSTISKERNNHEVSCDKKFCIKFFTAPNPNI